MNAADKYMQALRDGYEVVIVAEEIGYNSSIFWMEGGEIFCFNKEFGIMPRTDLDESALADHFELMWSNNAMMFIRGCINN